MLHVGGTKRGTFPIMPVDKIENLGIASELKADQIHSFKNLVR